MRTLERDKRTLHYAAKETVKSTTDGEVKDGYAQPTPFRATVLPVSGEMALAIYGARYPSVRTLYGSTVALKPDMGIWVDAAMDGEPDYAVLSAPDYPQERRYDIGKRGVFGG